MFDETSVYHNLISLRSWFDGQVCFDYWDNGMQFVILAGVPLCLPVIHNKRIDSLFKICVRDSLFMNFLQ